MNLEKMEQVITNLTIPGAIAGATLSLIVLLITVREKKRLAKDLVASARLLKGHSAEVTGARKFLEELKINRP